MYLQTHSTYSFQYGTLSPERLSTLGKQTSPHRLTLTDINNMAAHAEFAKACDAMETSYNLGVEFHWKGTLAYVLIARNENGYAFMNEWLSRWLELQKQTGHAEPITDFPEDVWVLYPPDQLPPYSPDHVLAMVRPIDLQQRFQWKNLPGRNKRVACPTLTFEIPRMFGFHKILRAIGENELLDRLSTEKTGSPLDFFRKPEEIHQLYSSEPDWLKRSQMISDSCTFKLDFSRERTRQHFHKNAAEDRIVLRSLAEEGKYRRYGNHPPEEVQRRIEKELDIIARLKFQGYYLITHDIIRYATHRGYPHVGRGSGANSIVAYCLGITDVDPIDLDLYFERFLNASRNSPPDFDIDFSWKERDDIIRYILQKYNEGHFRASQLAATVRYKSRSVLRELGKIYGLPAREIEKLTGRLPQQYFSTMEPLIQDPALHGKDNPVYDKLIRISQWLHKLPAHLSIHAGGILISERSLYETTASFVPPKGFPVAQIDMFAADDLNLHKLDILSQRGLGHIKDCIRLIAQSRGQAESDAANAVIRNTAAIVHRPESRQLLKSGETIGCFYIESPAMRSLILKMGCEDYRALTAASSVIRPGVGHSGMMRTFIARFRGDEKVTTLHPRLSELLKETFGVMIYQEDVLKVAHYFGGLSLEQADVLRRGMSGKLRSLSVMRTLQEAFYNSCRKQGIDEKIIQEVWRQMESFSGYTFPKAHSASFAVESFQDLYLKHHYPIEFMTAVVNNFGGFYNTWFYLEEAKRLGAEVALPCLNRSELLSKTEGRVIRLGFIHIAGLEQEVIRHILENRRLYGPFVSVHNFLERVPCGPEQMRILIRLGCLDFTGQSRAELLWEARLSKSALVSTGLSFFPPALPEKIHFPVMPWTDTEILHIEIEYLGFPVSGSFFQLLPTIPEDAIPSCDLMQHIGQYITLIGYICARKPIKTHNGKLMQFLTFRDLHGVWDGVLFPDKNQEIEIRRLGPWIVKGRVQTDFGVPVIEIREMRV